MNFSKIKARIVSVITISTMLLSSIPAYAEEQVDVVVENTETVTEVSDNGGEEPSGGQDNGVEVVELTITVEEIPSEQTEEIAETVSEQTEDATEVVNEQKEDTTESVTESAEDASQDNSVAENENDATKTESIGGEANNGERLNDAYTDLKNHYDSETKIQTSELNYTKVLSNFGVTQSSTGRYNATFTITETEGSSGDVKRYNYTVSGFASEEMARRYADAIESLGRYNGGETRYILADDDLIDAEKRPLSSNNATDANDSKLCWAGTTSNMLELSGWNKVAEHNYNGTNVDNEDKLFDLFANSFTDEAGNPLYGLEWFFNGVYLPQCAPDWSQLKDDDGYTTPMLAEYCSSDFITKVDAFSNYDLSNALKCLNADEDGDRCAVGIVFGYYECDANGKLIMEGDNEYKREGGHVVTVVGYSTDDKGIANTITIADSDNYNSQGKPTTPAANRTAYNNTYSTYPIKYYDGHWRIMNYVGEGYDTIIDDIIFLKYYGENTKDKTEAAGEATLDLARNYDFLVDDNYLIYGDAKYYSISTVYQGDELLGRVRFYNRGGIGQTDFVDNDITNRIAIYKKGEDVAFREYYLTTTLTGGKNEDFFFEQILMDADHPLDEGEYTVRYILNNSKGAIGSTGNEAYYNNNVSKIINRFVVVKRVTEDGKVDYIVVPDVSGDSNNNNNNDITTVDAEYQESLRIFFSNINEFSAVADQNTYINNSNATFEYSLSADAINVNITDADMLNAEISFDYSVSGNLAISNGNISSNVSLTKDDYVITRNADGSLSIEFTNAFMRKLPKGTHYFKLKIAGKIRIFKIEIK